MRSASTHSIGWPGPRGAIPSAFSLLSVPARLGRWSRSELHEFLGFGAGMYQVPSVGWATVARHDVAARIASALGRRPAEVRLGALLKSWYPSAMQPLLRQSDPSRYDRLRFCSTCLKRQGYHSPLFQLPWWTGCPIHSDPLLEGCPSCGAALPTALVLARPDCWLTCRSCGHELASSGELVGLHGSGFSPREISCWQTTLAEYRRWLGQTENASWAIPWTVEGDGEFSEVAIQAIAQLTSLVGIPSALLGHLPQLSTGAPAARAWHRTFRDIEKPSEVTCFGFTTPSEMRRSGRQFFGALPISSDCLRIIGVIHRRWRREVGVGLIRNDSPVSADPKSDVYVFNGHRPMVVMGFRLLTGLASTAQIEGVNYLDFRAPELMWEPPVWLAQFVLKHITGVDLRHLRRWPKSRDRADCLKYPSMVVVPVPSTSHSRLSETPEEDAPPSVDSVPGKALHWIYERLILEAWHDLAIECFARAVPNEIAAWATQKYFDKKLGFHRLSAVPRRFGDADAKELAHPLLVHARAQRRRPRGWAIAILRVGDDRDGRRTVAFLGRSGPLPFGPMGGPSFAAMWRWPDDK